MNEEQFCVVKAKHGDLEECEYEACDCLAKMKPIIIIVKEYSKSLLWSAKKPYMTDEVCINP